MDLAPGKNLASQSLSDWLIVVNKDSIGRNLAAWILLTRAAGHRFAISVANRVMKEQQDSSQNVVSKNEGLATPSSSEGLDDSLLKSSTPSDLNSESSTERDARLAIPSRPAASFAALITEAINSSPEKQMVLSDIYSYIEGHYKYFKTAGSGWKVLFTCS